jgi:large subunit ribosomal protein L30
MDNQMEKVRITQVKSIIDRPEDQKRTVRALGFTKMHQTIEKDATPQIKGMIRKVSHLLKIETV